MLNSGFHEQVLLLCATVLQPTSNWLEGYAALGVGVGGGAYVLTLSLLEPLACLLDRKRSANSQTFTRHQLKFELLLFFFFLTFIRIVSRPWNKMKMAAHLPKTSKQRGNKLKQQQQQQKPKTTATTQQVKTTVRWDWGTEVSACSAAATSFARWIC